jgi:hypothetical protein
MTDDIKTKMLRRVNEWRIVHTSVILNLGHMLEEGQVTNITFLLRNAKEKKAIWKI